MNLSSNTGPHSNALLTGMSVLLVEDETMISFLIEDMLNELGAASVRLASSLNAGLSLAAAHVFELALLDVNVGGQLVYPLADDLNTRGVPFVFITGYGEHGLERRWERLEVVQKPFTLDSLERALRKVMAQRERA